MAGPLKKELFCGFPVNDSPALGAGNKFSSVLDNFKLGFPADCNSFPSLQREWEINTKRQQGGERLREREEEMAREREIYERSSRFNNFDFKKCILRFDPAPKPSRENSVCYPYDNPST